jgi:zinc protease
MRAIVWIVLRTGCWLALAVMLAACTRETCHPGPAKTPAPPPAPSAATAPQARAADPSESADTVLRARLANGLQVVVVPNRLAPVVTTVVNYLAGSDEAPPGFPGTAHAQEHMMFRGSPGLSAAQLAAIAAGMGGRFNADTQQTVTQYFFTVPSSDLEVALRVEADRMRGVLDSGRLWGVEKLAIEQEVQRDLSNPLFVLQERLLGALYAGTPYAHSALGTLASFQQTSAPMLEQFYDTWYAPNNAILVIAGDVNPARALAQVRQYFEDIPAKSLPARRAIELGPVEPKSFTVSSDLPYGVAVLAFRWPGYDSPDYAAAKVLAEVLDSRRGALYALVPNGKALAAGFDLDALPQASIASAQAVFPIGVDGKAVLAELRKALASALDPGISPELVQAAQRSARTDLAREETSISGLAMAWSQALAVEGRPSPAAEVKAIEKVQPADVRRVARQLIDFRHGVSALVLSQSPGKPVSTSAFGGPESVLTEQSGPAELPAWASRVLGKAVVPRFAPDPAVTTLENGLLLIVQPTHVGTVVDVYGQVRHEADLESPKGQEGVDDVLSALFDYGTQSLDRLAFQTALDEIGATASAGTDFELHVLGDYFERGVELLADNQLRPALPRAAFETQKRQIASAVAGLLKSPEYLAQRALQRGLVPPGDPSLRQATPQSVRSLTLADVESYYRKVFRPDLTSIVVIGDVSPERARQVVEKYFGGWSNHGPKPATDLPPVPLNGASSTTVPDPTRVQDSVTLAQMLGLTRHDPEYYPLELGNHVLGGGFYATRLYHDLRETRGLVYNVNSSFDMTRTRGVYRIEFGADPSKVSEAEEIIVRNMRQMGTTLVSPSELERAKALLLRQIPLDESSARSIASGYLERVELGLPLDEPKLAARRYAELGAEQVRDAFARWVRPEAFVLVSRGPH